MKSIFFYTLQSCILMVLGCFAVPGLSSANDLETAKVHWQKYFTEHEPYIQSTQDELRTSGTRSQRNVRQCIQNASNSLIIANMGYAEGKFQEVYGANQQYVFTLKQNLPGMDAILHGVTLKNLTDQQERVRYYSITSPHFTYDNIPLTEFMSHPDVKIGSIENDGAFIAMNFTYTYRYHGKPYRSHTGKLFLDPACFYCINHAIVTIIELTSKSPEVVNEINYTYKSGDVPIILQQKSVTKIVQLQDQLIAASETVVNYDTIIEKEIDPKRFRLSYYGLPEPVGVVWSDTRPLWHWLLGGVILTSLLAILFRMWAKSARLKTVTPTTVE